MNKLFQYKQLSGLDKLLLSWQLQNGQYVLRNINNDIVASIRYTSSCHWFLSLKFSFFSSEDYLKIISPNNRVPYWTNPEEAMSYAEAALLACRFRFVPTKALVMA